MPQMKTGAAVRAVIGAATGRAARAKNAASQRRMMSSMNRSWAMRS